jgi:hypothetical protein
MAHARRQPLCPLQRSAPAAQRLHTPGAARPALASPASAPPAWRPRAPPVRRLRLRPTCRSHQSRAYASASASAPAPPERSLARSTASRPRTLLLPCLHQPSAAGPASAPAAPKPSRSRAARAPHTAACALTSATPEPSPLRAPTARFAPPERLHRGSSCAPPLSRRLAAAARRPARTSRAEPRGGERERERERGRQGRTSLEGRRRWKRISTRERIKQRERGRTERK